MKNIDLRIAAVWALSCLAGSAAAQQPPPSTLPVKQVTLFTSGVAYTERGGTVDGDAAVPLTFRTAQINDILKSMVLLDRGGKVQPATYGSRDPIGRSSARPFAVDVYLQHTARFRARQPARSKGLCGFCRQADARRPDCGSRAEAGRRRRRQTD